MNPIHNKETNNVPFRFIEILINGEMKSIPVSEDDFCKIMFNDFKMHSVKNKRKLVNALKNGRYVIAVDYSPFIFHNVFHIENGVLEFFKFRDIGPSRTPLKLIKEQVIVIKNKKMLDSCIESLLPKYDDFLLNERGILIDTRNIPLTFSDYFFSKVKINQL